MAQPQDDTFSGFTLYLARLWRARWFIVGTAALLAIVTYINLKFLTLETFRSEAVLYLSEDIEAPTVNTLVTSSDALDAVRTRFRQQFPGARGLAYLDQFAKRFHVAHEIVEDNSIRKTYSPAVVVSADANSPKEAQALATIWLDEISRRFGGASGGEARFRIQNTRNLLEDLAAQEKAVVQRSVALQHRSVELESRLYGLVNLLSPAEILSQQPDREFNAYVKDYQPPQKKVSVAIPPRAAPGEPGLIEKELLLRTSLEKNRAELQSYQKQLVDPGTGATLVDNSGLSVSLQDRISGLRAEIAGKEAEAVALSGQVARAQDELSSLSLSLQGVKADLATAQTELAGLRLQQEFAGSSLAEYTVPGYLSTRENSTGEGTASRLDFAVVSKPSLPDRKVAPQRLLSSVLAAAVGVVLASLVLGLMHLIDQLPLLSRRKAG